MRIVFTHNLQRSDDEAEAEFDSPETVEAIIGALEELGHEVFPVDVDAPVVRLVSLLDQLKPELVFNTAEGWRGRSREAFYPALFESLGVPFVGSDAHACTLTLDKHASKALVAPFGVPTPGWAFVSSPDDALPEGLSYPLIVKPNFEGSSKGIDAHAIVEDAVGLRERLADACERYPEGVIVEEFIRGWDVVVPFVEGVGPRDGVLPAADYRIRGESAHGAWAIYDFTLKHEDSDFVSVHAPADLPEALAEDIARWSRVVIDRLGVRDMGRLDWRITADGRAYFLEVNALPSLEPGASIYASGALVGLDAPSALLEAVLQSACARQGIHYSTWGPARPRPVRVGLCFNMKRTRASPDGTGDHEAEYDSPTTIKAITEAIASFGHEVVPLEADRALLTTLGEADVDVVFNIAEGIHGRGREALVPAVLDLLEIPYTGSDATTLAVTLDKALAKRLVREAGIATPDFALLMSPSQRPPERLGYPLIVKPVAEGSSKGVVRTSVVESPEELRATAAEIIKRYNQPALVEAFLPGREFTVGVVGGSRPRVFPPMEILYRDADDRHPIYTFEHKLDTSAAVGYQAPADVDDALSNELKRVALECWEALGCRDVARIDMRLDADGEVCFIECNPLPGLTPGWSDLCLIAGGAGVGYRELIGAILAPALRRYRRQLRHQGRS